MECFNHGLMLNEIQLYIIFIFVCFKLISGHPPGLPTPPDFIQPIANQTVPVGRDATFTCLVSNLGGYRIGWVKTDSKAIQAIHDHVITHNPRVWVSNNDPSTWNLHIKNVQEDDRGQYMCQINTDPMKSQIGYLDVVIPPDIIYEETSSDVMVNENTKVTLTCKARGYPKPHIMWRREDNEDIIIMHEAYPGVKEKVSVIEGETMELLRVSRTAMGAYLCIASNGIPPSVSKRIIINVHFGPVMQVPNQLVGAPYDTNVTLECIVEAYPKPIIYWDRKTGGMIATNEKYETTFETRTQFQTKMTLVVKNFQPSDIGTYKCNAKNSDGDVEGNIRLYEIPGPTRHTNAVYENDVEYSDKHNNHKNEVSNGYSYYPKNNAANKVNHSTKSSPNNGLALHDRTTVVLVFFAVSFSLLKQLKYL